MIKLSYAHVGWNEEVRGQWTVLSVTWLRFLSPAPVMALWCGEQRRICHSLYTPIGEALALEKNLAVIKREMWRDANQGLGRGLSAVETSGQPGRRGCERRLAEHKGKRE